MVDEEGLEPDVSVGYHRKYRPRLKDVQKEQCKVTAPTNRNMGKKNYCAQNQFRRWHSGSSGSSQIHAMF